MRFTASTAQNIFDTGAAYDKIGEKLLLRMAFMAPIRTLIQLRTGEVVAAKRVIINMGKQLRAQILDKKLKLFTQKSVSMEACTDSASSSSPLHKDDYRKAYRRCSGQRSRSLRHHRRHRKDEKVFSTSIRYTQSDGAH